MRVLPMVERVPLTVMDFQPTAATSRVSTEASGGCRLGSFRGIIRIRAADSIFFVGQGKANCRRVVVVNS